MRARRRARNGGQTAWRLREVGIETARDSRSPGAVEACERLKNYHPKFVSMNAPYALEGALREGPWNRLPPNVRARLVRAASEAAR